MSGYKEYLNTWSGRELLKKYKLSDYGIWRVKGEDPNCDMGGHHYQPDLGTVEGTLSYVIQHAVNMSKFWTWGGGGTIEAVVIRKVNSDSIDTVRLLLERKKMLSEQLKAIDVELGKYNVHP